jgi:glycosyltransferase involved in cell wall biosynthesis
MSGGDRHLLEVASRWRERVDLTILAPEGFEAVAAPFLPGVRIARCGSIGARRRRGGPLLALEYLRRGAAALAARHPPTDAVLASSHFLPDAAGLAAATRDRALGVVYVYHLIAGRAARDPRTAWSKTDERLALRVLRGRAAVVFTSNPVTERALHGRGFEPVHTSVGLDLAVYAGRSLRRRSLQALYLARMVPTKGVLDAVRAWAKVAAALPGAQLVMAGDGPQRAEAGRLVQSLGLRDRVRFPGFVGEEEKRRLLAESSLLLAPSFEEGFGLSVAEALATGTPVVAYRLPVLDELFGDVYLGAPAGDVDRLAELTRSVLTDGTQADALAQAGIQAVRSFDLGDVAEHELAVILGRLP